MKIFDELTPSEKTQLSYEHKQFYIDLVCAEQGVKLLPVEPEAPIKPVVPNDLEYAEFSGFNVDIESAQAIMSIIKSAKVYDNNYGSGPLKEIDDDSYNYPNLKSKRGMSAGLYSTHKAELDNYTDLKSQYDVQQREYSEIFDARQEAKNCIFNAIEDAQDFVFRQERLASEWERYVELANRDLEVAKKFMSNTYPANELEECLPEVFTKAVEA